MEEHGCFHRQGQRRQSIGKRGGSVVQKDGRARRWARGSLASRTSGAGRRVAHGARVHLAILRLKNRRAWSAGSRDCWCVFAILLLVVCSDPSEQQDCSAGVCCPPYRFPSSSTVMQRERSTRPHLCCPSPAVLAGVSGVSGVCIRQMARTGSKKLHELHELHAQRRSTVVA